MTAAWDKIASLLTSAIWIGAALSLAGCSSMQWKRPSPSITSNHTKVPGILEHAAENGKSRIVVFSTHGMGGTERCYADTIAEMFDPDLRERNGGELGHFSCVSPKNGVTRASVMPVCLDRSYLVTGEGLDPSDRHYLGGECLSGVPSPDIQSDYKPKDDQANDTVFSRFGLLLRQDLETEYQGRTMPVTIFSYYWNADAWWLQYPYLSPDLKLIGATKLNRGLKEIAVNYGFSDAVLYTGVFGDVMRKGVQNALCLMILESEPGHAGAGTSHTHGAPCSAVGEGQDGGLTHLASTQMAYLSESLGSRILFDALNETSQLKKEESAALRAISKLILDTDPIIYMSANQLPLLGLARFSVRSWEQGVEASDEDFLQRFLAADGARPGHGREIVAFHDPNDLLGYRGGTHLRSSSANNIIEVTQHYAKPFGLLADPMAAHNKSFRNHVSRQIVLCGAENGPDGTLVIPDNCR